MLKDDMKLIDVLLESMADGKAFQAFTDNAIAKKEVQSNEGLNLEKAYKIYSPSTGLLTKVKKQLLDKMLSNDDVFPMEDREGYYTNLTLDQLENKYKI